MSALYKKLPDEPIVIVTLPKDYNLVAELPTTLPFYLKELDSFKERVFWIVDAREEVFSTEDIIQGAALVAKGQHPLYKHPNIRQVIYVATSRIIKLTADGLGKEAFGKVAIKLFDNLDAALQFCREYR